MILSDLERERGACEWQRRVDAMANDGLARARHRLETA